MLLQIVVSLGLHEEWDQKERDNANVVSEVIAHISEIEKEKGKGHQKDWEECFSHFPSIEDENHLALFTAQLSNLTGTTTHA